MCVWVPIAKYAHLSIKRPYMHSLGSLGSILSNVVKFPFVRRLSDYNGVFFCTNYSPFQVGKITTSSLDLSTWSLEGGCIATAVGVND